jgi:hypothetical protein
MTTPRSPRDLLPGRVTRRHLALGLMAAAGAFGYQAVTSTGLDRLLMVPLALTCAVVALLLHFHGRPGFGVVRILAGLGGVLVMLAGLAAGALGVGLAVAGGFGLLAAVVLVPAAFLFVMWGWMLVRLGLNAR